MLDVQPLYNWFSLITFTCIFYLVFMSPPLIVISNGRFNRLFIPCIIYQIPEMCSVWLHEACSRFHWMIEQKKANKISSISSSFLWTHYMAVPVSPYPWVEIKEISENVIKWNVWEAKEDHHAQETNDGEVQCLLKSFVVSQTLHHSSV